MRKDGKWRIGIDMDGTLAEYSGYKGPDHVGRLLPGAREWLEELVADGHELFIFTARANDPDGLNATFAWIERERIGHLITGVTGEKLYSFDMFVDDRAVRFEGKYPPLEVVNQTRPWWK